MLTTEAEAAEKWCPAGRITALPDHATINNRGEFADEQPKCIGSRCMAWRWGSRDVMAFRDPGTPDGATRFVDSRTGMRQARDQGLDPLGRCGLGGEP
jgi:hypothetical protein